MEATPVRGQRHVLAIDLGTDARIANPGVNGIGKINRRRTAGQLDDLALWRETEHLVLKQLKLGMLQELFRVVTI